MLINILSYLFIFNIKFYKTKKPAFAGQLMIVKKQVKFYVKYSDLLLLIVNAPSDIHLLSWRTPFLQK
jgi:hypothetical protein